MSKQAPNKANSQSAQKIPREMPVVHKSGLHVAAVREVSALHVMTNPENKIGAQLQRRRQKQQMLFAFSLFLLLGLLILTGQMVSKPRMLASAGLTIPAEDCAKTEGGEKACLTHTSTK